MFQGVISNQRSQPVIVDWFAVRFAGTTPQGIIPLGDLAESTALTATLSNDGAEVVPAEIEALRVAAVTARDHMQRLRTERVDHVMPLLMAETKRLKEWRRRGLEQLEARREAVESSGRKLCCDEARRLQDAEEHIRRQIKARGEWIKAGMATSELPYLRLALVLVPRLPILRLGVRPPAASLGIPLARRARTERSADGKGSSR